MVRIAARSFLDLIKHDSIRVVFWCYLLCWPGCSRTHSVRKEKATNHSVGGFSMRASNGGCQQCQTTERQLWMAASCVEAARWRDERVVAFVSDCWYLNAGKHYSQCQYVSSQA